MNYNCRHGHKVTAFVLPVWLMEVYQHTFSVGSVSVDQMQLGLTGQSATSSVGSVTVNDLTIGLTGQSFTASN